MWWLPRARSYISSLLENACGIANKMSRAWLYFCPFHLLKSFIAFDSEIMARTRFLFTFFSQSQWIYELYTRLAFVCPLSTPHRRHHHRHRRHCRVAVVVVVVVRRSLLYIYFFMGIFFLFLFCVVDVDFSRLQFVCTLLQARICF